MIRFVQITFISFFSYVRYSYENNNFIKLEHDFKTFQKVSTQIHKKFETRGMHEFYHNYFNECHSRITDRRISRVNKLNRIENINRTILNANSLVLRCWYVRKKKRIECLKSYKYKLSI